MHRQNTKVNKSPKRILRKPATTLEKYITLPVIEEIQSKIIPGDTGCLQMGKYADTFQNGMREY